MRRYFLTGLVILLPITLTVWILVFLVNLLTKPFLGIIDYILSLHPTSAYLLTIPATEKIIHYSSQVLILFILFFLTCVLGMVARWFFFKGLLKLGDHILHRIPIVNKVYKTSKDIIRTIFASKTTSFKKVVMVPFPDDTTFAIGLLAGESPPRCKGAARSDLISVFIPTTPNPTSGYLLMFPREKCQFIDMRVEEAVKFIISCGVIHSGMTPEEELLMPPSVQKESDKKKKNGLSAPVRKRKEKSH